MLIFNIYCAVTSAFTALCPSHFYQGECCVVLFAVTYSGTGWTPRCCCWPASRDDHCRAGHTSHSGPPLCGEYTGTCQAPGKHIRYKYLLSERSYDSEVWSVKKKIKLSESRFYI